MTITTLEYDITQKNRCKNDKDVVVLKNGLKIASVGFMIVISFY